MANDMTANRPDPKWEPWKVLFLKDWGNAVCRDSTDFYWREYDLSEKMRPVIYDSNELAQSRANHLNGQTS